MPHVKTICSFASLLFFHRHQRNCPLHSETCSTDWNKPWNKRQAETSRQSTPASNSGNGKEKGNICEQKTNYREIWRQRAKRWVFSTIFSVCVTSFLSLNINKPFVCSQLCIFVHHMMYFWGLCLHWAKQPICEAKWEQIMMASVPISLGIFLCCLLIGKSSNTWLNHHLWNTAEKEVTKQ